MALSKPFNIKNTTQTIPAYFSISKIEITLHSVDISVEIFASPDFKDEGKPLNGTLFFSCQKFIGEELNPDFENFFLTEGTQDIINGSYTAAYNYLKTLPEFAEAEDC